MPGPKFVPPEHCLKKLQVGDKVREKKSGIVFIIAEHEHEGWKDTTTLVTDCVIKNAAYDAKEPESVNKFTREFGNNDYTVSNIHSWLNSDRVDWYRPAHFKDMPPEGEYVERTPEFYFHCPDFPEVNKLWGPFDYKDEAGFLTRFPERFQKAVMPVRIPVLTMSETGVVEKKELYTGVFLPSLKEVGYELFDEDGIGSRFELFEDPRYRICSPSNEAVSMPDDYEYKDVLWWFLTRSIMPSMPGYVFKITPGYRGGTFSSRQAMFHRCCMAGGIRPFINLNWFYPVAEEPDENGIYDLIEPPAGANARKHNMMAIPSNLTQTLSANGRVDERIIPGCVCTNLTCIRHGLCEPCEYYHSSAYGMKELFEPTCKGDHFNVDPEVVERCYDDLGRIVMTFKEAQALMEQEKKDREQEE